MNPQCQAMVQLLLDFVDGTLEAEREAEFRAHLCGCLPCYIYLETYHATIKLTRTLPKCEMPMEFKMRLKAMLEKETKT
jgi:anti-sigma factor RsiW